MLIIGLCGGTGSGKGAVCDIFGLFGIPSVDTDKVYREITEGNSPCLDALKAQFGEKIITPLGSLDRKALSLVVFDSHNAEEKRQKLNEITHRFILARTREILSQYKYLGYKAAIVDAPLLFESGFDKECDIIVSVIADKELRFLRIIKRDKLSREAAEKRINSQLSDEELTKRSDYQIINNGDISELEAQIKKIAEVILTKEGQNNE